jgi:hypothetical protein
MSERPPDPSAVTVTAPGPAFLPYHSRWNEDAYTVAGDFRHRPCAMRASSTGGAPVLLAGDVCIGLLDHDPSAVFQRVGGQITVTARDPASIFLQRGDPEAGWRAYERALRVRHPDPDPVPGPRLRSTLMAVEYCTWCEQKWLAEEAGRQGMPGAVAMLDHGFVLDYLERIDRLGLPPGVVTLDHGWSEGASSFRFDEIVPDPVRFPDLGATARAIRSAGHVPGAWLAPAFLWPDHPLFAAHPCLMGPRFSGANEGGFQFPLHYLRVDAATEHLVRDRFRRALAPLVALGFGKFKIDFLYEDRGLMGELLRVLRTALKDLDPDAELESHIPDWFAARWQDAVRLNDLVPEQNPAWAELLDAHYRVCAVGASGRQLNLDHIGTNSPRPSSELYRASIARMRGKDGYPVVSLLPDRLDDAAVAALQAYLADYGRIGSAVLDRRLHGADGAG